MAARDDLLALLKSGGYAKQESGYGPFACGSDGRVYSARTARSLERDGLARLQWTRREGRFLWAWVLADKAPNERAEAT